MNIEKMTGAIQNNPELMSQEKIVICLNRSCDSMLEDAFLLTASGEVQDACWTACSGGGQADEASVQLAEDGDDLVTFHETRPNSKDHRPNGIRVHHEDLDFQCVVFYNGGEEPLTVDGKWLAPGEFTAIQELDPNSPEAQRFWAAYFKSPELLKDEEELRRRYAEMEKERRQAREKGGQA